MRKTGLADIDRHPAPARVLLRQTLRDLLENGAHLLRCRGVRPGFLRDLDQEQAREGDEAIPQLALTVRFADVLLRSAHRKVSAIRLRRPPRQNVDCLEDMFTPNIHAKSVSWPPVSAGECRLKIAHRSHAGNAPRL